MQASDPMTGRSVAKALDFDFAPPRSPSEDAVLHYERTYVPVSGYDTMLKGKLVEMLDSEDGLAVGALYRTLIEEVSARTNDTTEYNSIEEIYAQKSLSRKNLTDVFLAAENRRGILDSWSIIDDELKNGGHSFPSRIRLQNQTIIHLRRCANRNAESIALSNAIIEAFEKVKAAASACEQLLPAVEIIKAQLEWSELSSYDAIEIDAAIFVELFEAINGQ